MNHMNYLLDTNVCIAVMRNLNPELSNRVIAQPPGIIALCTIVEAELFKGAYHSTQRNKNIPLVRQFIEQFPSVPFDRQATEIAGQLWNNLAIQGLPIGPYDLLIASIALAHNLTLITHNTREFGRIPSLRCEDWETM